MITKEYETIELLGVKLDVHYSVFNDGCIQLDSIESIAYAQDLMPIMNQDLFEDVIDMLKAIEAKKGD